MSTQYGEAKMTPARERDRTAQDARTARTGDGEAARSPAKKEEDGELYNLPFTD